ncbi:MAG TPA: hypothetical protein VFB74_33230, partial [Kribbellaceae bacterium]|nr:hypothetical protein [Kribbellaceae bacterium]
NGHVLQVREEKIETAPDSATRVHIGHPADTRVIHKIVARTHDRGRRHYKALRERGIGHHAAIRQLGNRLVGILHGCLKTATTYNETTAWAHHHEDLEAAT